MMYRRVWGKHVLAASVCLTAACSSDPTEIHNRASGYATYSGRPLVGATVRAWQLYQGDRTIPRGETTTDIEGHWAIDVGGQYVDAAF